MQSPRQVFQDSFGRPVAKWICAAASAVSDSTRDSEPQQCVSIAVKMQLGSYAARFGHGTFLGSAGLYSFPHPDQTDASSAACLLHGRHARCVSNSRGDAITDLDLTEEFLSCRGVCLTMDPTARQALGSITERYGYPSPYWISLAELSTISTSRLLVGSLGLRDALECSEHLRGLFRATGASARCVTLLNDRREECAVVNLSELQSTAAPNTALTQHVTIGAFRKYSPVNVRTRAPFAAAIEDRLRLESWSSWCWCTLWGTFEDFEAVGCPALDGALGLRVFDEFGNDVFITNAMCTSNPAAAYSSAYPSDCTYFVA